MSALLRHHFARWILLLMWLGGSLGGLLYVEYEAALRGVLCMVRG